MREQFLADKDKLEKQDAEMKKKLDAGEITKAQYKSWRSNLEKQIQKDARKLAIILGGADQLATDDVNMEIPDFYSEAENYQTYETEQRTGVDTSFSLVNKNSITRAMYGAFFADIDLAKNSAWNQRRIRSAITAGIIAGESIPDIAKRLKPLVGGNEKSAIRNARTWVGSAVTGGRQESAEKSTAAGVDLVKWWTAVHDLRTRISHRHLDRTWVEVDEKFDNGGLYPGDPQLPPEERYNCRCDVLYYPRGFTPSFENQRDVFDMSYEEWKEGKQKAEESRVVNGKDISSTWERRPDKFDFEIEDVMNAQGFDGLPKVVDDDEFEKAVKESGLITNRGYTAPNKEALELYHRELLKGKWYVRCSGGNMFGYGMYTAGNYGTKLSQTSLGTAESYSLGMFGMRETMTLDKSAKIINHNDIFMLKRGEAYNYYLRALEKDGVKLTPAQMAITKLNYTNDPDDMWYKFTPQELDKANKGLKKYDKYFKESWEYEKRFESMDAGVYAALKGYDAIESDQGGDNKYFIILNRTKVIVKRG